ncbi:hypothetical protein PENTCL1PPCAC_3091, partial [Pristionchus entomophagus]
AGLDTAANKTADQSRSFNLLMVGGLEYTIIYAAFGLFCVCRMQIKTTWKCVVSLLIVAIVDHFASGPFKKFVHLVPKFDTYPALYDSACFYVGFFIVALYSLIIFAFLETSFEKKSPLPEASPKIKRGLHEAFTKRIESTNNEEELECEPMPICALVGTYYLAWYPFYFTLNVIYFLIDYVILFVAYYIHSKIDETMSL